MKICLVGSELFIAEGRTDKIKLKIAFRNFAEVRKNETAREGRGSGPKRSVTSDVLCYHIGVPQDASLSSMLRRVSST
jgi:hypothetical protein